MQICATCLSLKLTADSPLARCKDHEQLPAHIESAESSCYPIAAGRAAPSPEQSLSQSRSSCLYTSVCKGRETQFLLQNTILWATSRPLDLLPDADAQALPPQLASQSAISRRHSC